MIERMRVVPEPRVARVFLGSEPTAGRVAPFDAEHLESGLAEIGLKNQAVVPGAQDDAVVSSGLRSTQRGDSRLLRGMNIDSRSLSQKAMKVDSPSGLTDPTGATATGQAVEIGVQHYQTQTSWTSRCSNR